MRSGRNDPLIGGKSLSPTDEVGNAIDTDLPTPAKHTEPAARLRQTIARRLDVVVVLGLAIALWLPRLSGPIDLRYDSGVYYLLGTSLANGEGYRIPSEPGSPEALQYPPLLPGIVAAYQCALGTSDPTIVGSWLRMSYFLLFAIYALVVLALARRYLRPAFALAATALCLLHNQSIFLSDLLFAELPFAVVSVVFVLVAGTQRQFARPWLGEALSFALGAAGFLLRTAGIALLAAWTLEAFTRKRWRLAFTRGALALVPIVAWQAYVGHVRTSYDYNHPAYEYQRAPYQYYNVSYAENALLVDPFRPELGRVGPAAVATRLIMNVPSVVAAIGEAVSTSEFQWRQLLRKVQQLLPRSIIPLGAVFVPILGLAAFVITGIFILVRRRAWLTVFVLVGTIALVWTTPWPAQFSRYLAPLAPFLAVCLCLACSQTLDAIRVWKSNRRGTLARCVVAAVLVLAFGMETYTAIRLFHARQLPEGIVLTPPSGGKPYRLFAHNATWRAWEEAADWVGAHSTPDTIVATTAPHFLSLRTGRKAVLPPMESDVTRERHLLESVPVSYVIIDNLEFLDVSRRYARPAVESDSLRWRLVHTANGTKTYQRITAPQ